MSEYWNIEQCLIWAATRRAVEVGQSWPAVAAIQPQVALVAESSMLILLRGNHLQEILTDGEAEQCGSQQEAFWRQRWKSLSEITSRRVPAASMMRHFPGDVSAYPAATGQCVRLIDLCLWLAARHSIEGGGHLDLDRGEDVMLAALRDKKLRLRGFAGEASAKRRAREARVEIEPDVLTHLAEAIASTRPTNSASLMLDPNDDPSRQDDRFYEGAEVAWSCLTADIDQIREFFSLPASDRRLADERDATQDRDKAQELRNGVGRRGERRRNLRAALQAEFGDELGRSRRDMGRALNAVAAWHRRNPSARVPDEPNWPRMIYRIWGA